MKPFLLTKQLGLILLIAIVLGISAYHLFSKTNSPRDHVITITSTGFVPATLSIKQGDRVTFVADNSVAAFWPASDAHPSHNIYPEFDAGEAIAADGSWSFVFDRVGLWRAHDHLNSHSRGEIVVYSQDGQLTKDCLDRKLDDEKVFQPECWEAEFSNLLQNDGETKMFETFNAYLETDELFKNNCHDVMHIIGRLLQEKYQETGQVGFSTDVTSCGYGFFHGFVEEIYNKTGSYISSREFCDYLENSDQFLSENLADGAAAACWHGIGHAIFDSQDSTKWGQATAMMEAGLAECEMIFSDQKRRQGCASGIFNALSNAFSNTLYDLAYDESDIFSHCRNLESGYQGLCLLDVGVFYASDKRLSKEAALNLFEAADQAYWPLILEAWMSDNTQWRTASAESAYQEADFCFSFASTVEVNACMKGVHSGIFKKNGPLQNQVESNKVCDYFIETTKRDKCREYIYVKI